MAILEVCQYHNELFNFLLQFGEGLGYFIAVMTIIIGGIWGCIKLTQ